MCKEGWYVGLWQEGGCLHEGCGNNSKYFKRGWDRKEGRGNKDFKGGQVPLINSSINSFLSASHISLRLCFKTNLQVIKFT